MLRSAAVALVLAQVALLAAGGVPSALPCAAPQPRAIHASELVSGREALDPPYSVLHRCDAAAGACRGGRACVPTATELVTLVFLSLGQPFDAQDQSDFHLVRALNHTACGCRHPDEASSLQ